MYNTEVINRFWSHVNKQGALWTDPQTGESSHCWEWTAGIIPKQGYGIFSPHHTSARAHRVSYEIAFGKITDGLFVLHKCDNRKCVNPSHLELGTHEKNMRDMKERGRAATGENNGTHLYPDRLARGDRNGHATQPEKTKRGDKHGRAKLTWEQVDRIRERIANKEPFTEIAKDYPVIPVQIWRIAHFITWKKR